MFVKYTILLTVRVYQIVVLELAHASGSCEQVKEAWGLHVRRARYCTVGTKDEAAEAAGRLVFKCWDGARIDTAN